MKKISLLFWSIAMTLFFAGCKSEEGLTLDSFKEKATIRGNVFYSLGQYYADNNYVVDKRVNAQGKTVYLDVPNSEYQPGALGVHTFSAVVDADGNYSFAIPVKVQGATSGTIRLEEFSDKRQVYQGMVSGSPSFKSEEVVFSYTEAFSVSKGNVVVRNFSYNFTPVSIPNTYKEYITFTGNVTMAYEKGFRDGALKNADGKSVELSVNYPELGGKFNFGATVDNTGSYTIKVPVQSKKNAITVAVKPVSYVASDYVHYPASTDQKTLSGVYSAQEKDSTTKSGFSDDIVYNMGTQTLYFSPNEAPSTYTTNLAGWVQLDPKVYPYSVTLTGSVSAQYEKSYLTGDYAPVAGKTVAVAVNMGTGYGTQTYVLATDSKGLYNLPIKLPAKNMSIAVSASTENYGVANYTHYLQDGTTTTLNGYYQSNYFDISNKTVAINEFSTTYALDNLYRIFTPLDASSVKDWYANLFGWYQVAGKKSTVTITGAVKKAIEGAPDTSKPTAWQVAKWTGATSQLFYITISGKTLVALSGLTGQYNLVYPVAYTIDAASSYTLPVAVSTPYIKIANFTHYADMTSAAISISGTYYGSLTSTSYVIDNTNSVCTVKDCYMYFTPNSVPTAWSSYVWTTTN